MWAIFNFVFSMYFIFLFFRAVQIVLTQGEDGARGRNPAMRVGRNDGWLSAGSQESSAGSSFNAPIPLENSDESGVFSTRAGVPAGRRPETARRHRTADFDSQRRRPRENEKMETANEAWERYLNSPSDSRGRKEGWRK